jgi:hypothetical protein
MHAPIVPLVLSLAIGYLVAALCLRPGRRAVASQAFAICLGAGAGLAITSGLAFVLLCGNLLSVRSLAGAEAGLVVALAGLYYAAWRRAAPQPAPSHSVPRAVLGRIGVWIVLAVYLGALVCGVLTWTGFARPHGEWDAWAIWNLRARFLFRGLSQWHDAFSPFLPHADYPLLVPGSVLRTWLYMGEDATSGPLSVGFVLTFASVGVLTAGTALVRGASQGLLAGLLLLATETYARQGALQYADVPLSFFILATVVLLSLAASLPERKAGLYLLAGLAAGAAAWTKNEGMVFLVVVLAVLALVRLVAGGFRDAIAAIAMFLLGAAPFVAMGAYFRLFVAPPNDPMLAQGAAAARAHLGELARYRVILRGFGQALSNLGPGDLHPLILPGLYLACLGWNRDRLSVVNAATGGGVLLLMFGGYVAAYASTPNDLDWHIRNSAHRLLVQVWPAFLFVLFTFARSPEQAASVVRLPRVAQSPPTRKRTPRKR